MKLSWETKKEKLGLLMYAIGIVVYFMSWTFQIYNPQSDWSQSLWGFTAPAYTTIIWLVGIALVGNQAWIKIHNPSFTYILLSVLFVLVHTLHAYIVYQSIS